MPKLNITSSARFRPLSYKEMLEPLMVATQQQQQIEDQIGELDAKSSIFEGLTDAQRDNISHKRVTDFSTQLKQQSEALASQGLNPNTRRELSKLRASYAQHIVPIEQAYKRRRQLADEQRKASLQDPTLMFTPVNQISLDDFIANPELSPRAWSGALLAKQVAQQASTLAKTTNEDKRKWTAILGGRYYETGDQLGFTKEDVDKAMRGDSNANPMLTHIVEGVLNSSGISPELRSQARQFAAQGLTTAIGTTQYKTLANQGWAMEQKLEEAKNKPKPTAPLLHDIVRGAAVKDVNTVKMKEQKDFLDSVIKDPSLMDVKQSKKEVSPFLASTTRLTPETYEALTVTHYPNSEKLGEIAKQYNVDIKNLIQDGKVNPLALHTLSEQIGRDIQSSAELINSYRPRFAKNEAAIKFVEERARAFSELTGKSGLREINKNGNVGDYIDKKDMAKYFNSNTSFDYSPKYGWVIHSNVGGISSTKIKKPIMAVGDFELFDDTGSMRKAHREIINAINTGTIDKLPESINQIVHNGITAPFVGAVNSQIEAQPTTASRKATVSDEFESLY